MDKVDISKLLDGRGRLTTLPKKRAPRQATLSWLLRPFAHGRFYSEKEVNELLTGCCVNGDYTLLRRELIDSGLLSRTSSGSRYWRSDFLRGEIDCGGVLLRDLCNSDVPVLTTIHESLKYYDTLTGETHTPEDAQALIRKTDLPPGGSCEFFNVKMILTPDKRPAGYVMVYEGYPQPDLLWVGSLFLHQEYHRQGIGGTVMRTVEEQAGLSGFHQIGFGVYTQNTPGLQFWIKQGFCTIEKLGIDGRERAMLALIKKLSIDRLAVLGIFHGSY